MTIYLRYKMIGVIYTRKSSQTTFQHIQRYQFFILIKKIWQPKEPKFLQYIQKKAKKKRIKSESSEKKTSIARQKLEAVSNLKFQHLAGYRKTRGGSTKRTLKNFQGKSSACIVTYAKVRHIQVFKSIDIEQ